MMRYRYVVIGYILGFALTTAAICGVCAWMPDYSQPGATVCTPANQAVECRCSECISWTASVGPVVTRSYQVQRTDMDGTLHYGWNMGLIWTDDDGVERWTPPRTIYCPAKDDALMPVEGRLYKYAVKACNDAGCSAASASVSYVAAPYAYTFRPPVKGN